MENNRHGGEQPSSEWMPGGRIQRVGKGGPTCLDVPQGEAQGEATEALEAQRQQQRAKLRRAAVRGVMKSSWGVCVQKGVRAESSAGRRPRGVSAIRDSARRRPQEGLCDPCSPGISGVVASELRLVGSVML